jgi:hypothetical protein
VQSIDGQLLLEQARLHPKRGGKPLFRVTDVARNNIQSMSNIDEFP